MSTKEEIRDRLWNILPCPNEPSKCEWDDCDTCADRVAMIDVAVESLIKE